MKTSDLFIKALENKGVGYILGVPGEENPDHLHRDGERALGLPGGLDAICLLGESGYDTGGIPCTFHSMNRQKIVVTPYTV
ncbi:MAG: hypothetical protein AAGC73_09055 [Verrucomicrobiota bacterium]